MQYCGNEFDNTQNYMTYVEDACKTEFTPGQIVRMQMAWEVFRAVRGLSCDDPIEYGGKGKTSGRAPSSGKGRALRTMSGK
jgi:hypothetical protein